VRVTAPATGFRRELRVRHPAVDGRMILRTDVDWDRDVDADSVSTDGTTRTFTIESPRPFVYYKTGLRDDDGATRWEIGEPRLALMTATGAREVFPYFDGPESGSIAPLIELDSSLLGRKHRLCVYLPPGYAQNKLRKFPVVYMQDGKNLFFPEEAFLGRAWEVDRSIALLDKMGAIDQAVVIGIHSGDRMNDYTKPGYEAYARSIVEEVKPVVDRRLRVFKGRRETAVFGSSLGGVVSFFMAWQHPDVFGYAACMSSTFSYKDDLVERVLSEPKCTSKFYLDSGWPKDNYEVTLAMAVALSRRGYRVRQDFLHLVFPHDGHDENAWGKRLHIPLQLALGRASTAARGR
jgi:predicted alpha/beta superfamily hydrolase